MNNGQWSVWSGILVSWSFLNFADLVSNMVKETSSEELNEENANSSLNKLQQMNEMIFPIYDDLVTFASTLKEENLEMFKTKRANKGNGELCTWFDKLDFFLFFPS